MPHPSRRKGFDYEREVREAFRAGGLRCERAWGSDGTALRTDNGRPCTSDVDLLVEGRLKIQAKRRKAVASYIRPPAGAHVTVIREDRGESFAVLSLDLFARLIRAATQPQGPGTRTAHASGAQGPARSLNHSTHNPTPTRCRTH